MDDRDAALLQHYVTDARGMEIGELRRAPGRTEVAAATQPASESGPVLSFEEEEAVPLYGERSLERALGPIEVEFAVMELQQFAADLLERIQAYLDGASLGAEQVQDKRLEYLEAGPEVSTGGLFVDIAVTIFLESNLAGKLIVGVTRGTVRSLMRSNRLFHVLSPMTDGRSTVTGESLPIYRSRLAGFLQWYRREAGTRSARAFAALEVNRSEYVRYRRYLAAVARAATGQEQNLVAVAKGAWAGVQEKTREKPRPLPEPTDTPTVGILQTAQTTMSEHRLAIRVVAAFLEALLRSGAATVRLRQAIREAMSVDSLEVTTDELRERYKLAFEGLIWARLYGLDEPNMNLQRGGTQLRGASRGLTDYWLRRFAPLIEEWAEQGAQGIGMSGDPMPITPLRRSLLELARPNQLSYLHQWFLQLGQALPAAEDLFRSADRPKPDRQPE